MSVEAKLKLQIAEFTRNYTAAKNHAKKESAEMARASGGVGAALSKGMSGLGSIVGGAGIGLAIKDALSHADDLSDMAAKLNENTEALQRVDFAAKQAGAGGVEDLSKAMVKLERSLGDPENNKAAQALENLGVSAAQLASLPLDEKVLLLSDAFQKARDEGTGVNDIQVLLGKSAGELIPLFEQGGDALRAMFADAPVLAESTVQEMAKINDQFDAVIMKSKGFIAQTVGNLTGLGQYIKDLGLTDGIGGIAAFLMDPMTQVEAANDALIIRDLDARDAAKEREDARKRTAAAQQATSDKAASDAAENAKTSAADKAEEQIVKERARRAKQVADEVNALREKVATAEFDRAPDADKARMMRDQLGKSLGIDINGMADVERGMKSLRDEADAANRAGNVYGEKSALTRLDAAGKQLAAFTKLSGGSGDGRQGSFQNLVDQIFDRDPAAEQIAAMRDSLRKQDDLKRTMDDILKKMDDPVPRDFFSNFGQS